MQSTAGVFPCLAPPVGITVSEANCNPLSATTNIPEAFIFPVFLSLLTTVKFFCHLVYLTCCLIKNISNYLNMWGFHFTLKPLIQDHVDSS